MDIEARQLIELLLSTGLLDYATLVSGDVMIGAHRSRNLSYGVIRKRGQSYFVKKAQPGQPYAAETLRQEARSYDLIANDNALSALRPLIPQFYHYEERENVLILELLKD